MYKRQVLRGITADGIYEIHPATTHVHATYSAYLPTTAPMDQTTTADCRTDVNKHLQTDVAAIELDERTQVKTETENNGQPWTDETTHVKTRVQEGSDDNLQTELPSASIEADNSNCGSDGTRVDCVEALENRTAEAADRTASMLTAADYRTDAEFKDIYAYYQAFLLQNLC